MGYLHAHDRKGSEAAGRGMFAGLSVVLACCFVLQPVIAICIALAAGIYLNQRSWILLGTTILMVVFYLGLINIQKHPVSDLSVYLGWLVSARDYPFHDYLAAHSSEPVYFSFLHLLANLPRSSSDLFVFVSTVLSYAVFITAIARLAYLYKLPNYAIIGLIIFFAFLPPLFNNSAHLMRQFMAGALLAWFYSASVVRGRERWLVFLLALMTHTTAVFFLPLALLGEIRRLSPMKTLSLVALGLLAVYLVLDLGRPFFVGLAYFGPILKRVIAGSYLEHAPLGLAPLLLVGFLISAALFLLFFRSRDEVTGDRHSANSLCIASLCLGLFIIWAHLSDETMLATRFMLYAYFLLGPLMVMVIKELDLKVAIILLCMLTMPVYFGYALAHGVWNYGSGDDLAQALFIPGFVD